MEDEVVSLIDEKAEEGEWFPFKGKAEFRIKRVSQARRRALYRQNLGKTVADQPDFEKSVKFRIATAREALLDSRKVQILGRYLEGTALAGAAGEVLLDGKWTDEVKTVVLSEVPGVLNFVIAKVDAMSAKTDQEEEGKD